MPEEKNRYIGNKNSSIDEPVDLRVHSYWNSQQQHIGIWMTVHTSY
ncbi:hypothetical protein MTBBW1_2370009 [Desulfamplus magnetovallimortis]|uniref:Uncharacterized protein n=1 Tax=Desulfamplus magnetovallimortis TaxID=1246637 RepID=A0A1W1HE16_9BACT|nr:hypothetical protein MTBBW1_2370009 [Desulfamplus magnetovallimortis]